MCAQRSIVRIFENNVLVIGCIYNEQNVSHGPCGEEGVCLILNT